MEREKIEKINYYAHEQKIRALTDEERAEQAALRREYLAEIRQSFGAELQSTVVEYPDGTRKKLTELGGIKKK